jgi:hypothetical protein
LDTLGISEALFYQKDTITYYTALKFLESAIVYDKLDRSLYLKKSELLCRLGLFESGLKVIQEYNKIKGDDVDLILREGYLLEKKNDTAISKMKYTVALQLLNKRIKTENITERLKKHLNFQKVLLIMLLNDASLTNDLNEIRAKYAGDPEFNVVWENLQSMSRADMIDYQVTGGISKTIIVK